MIADPFYITGPAVISFSGGRTSAYMLWRILQSHGGVLPPDVIVCFANTGREMPATLDFVAECAEHWEVPVKWLEYRHGYEWGAAKRTRWAEIVNHGSASRNGEPFAMLLESKRIVPDRERRFCTEQLKVLTVARHLRSLGWTRWLNVVGFRADESVRVDRRQAEEKSHPGRWQSVFPLAVAGVQKLDVLRFWREQNFNLLLDADGDGGNCDGCFMFSSERLGRMFRKYPDRMDWWANIEKQYGTKTMRPGQSYAELREIALRQGVLAWDDGGDCERGCSA